jgi:hypothetical protein
MELRLISTVEERKQFVDGLMQARALKGRGFREKKASRLAQAHLAFADLYGVYDENGPAPDRMIGGFAMHNLAQFGPSCARPDLSHLPPETVYEIGELWSAVKGNGLSLRSARALVTARAGCVLIPGLKGARALFIYAVTRRWDMTTVYPEFEAVGAPIVYPYLETLDGGPVYVQPLVLQGHALAEVFAQLSTLRLATDSAYSWLRIENPFAIIHVETRLGLRRSDGLPTVRGFDSDVLERPFSRTYGEERPSGMSDAVDMLGRSMPEAMAELSTAG